MSAAPQTGQDRMQAGEPFDARAFRQALGQFPTGVCVVTTRVGDEDLGMTISSFNTLSLEPPLILFSIGRQAHSLPQWQAAAGYAVNVLSEGQRDLSNRFARPLGDKWCGLAFDRGNADAPLLRGTAAQFECRAYDCHDGGDHLLFVARVLRFRAWPERRPLIFCGGNYQALQPNDGPAPAWPLSIHY